MKTCAECGKELKASVDEYGDIYAPVCIDCWFDAPTSDPLQSVDAEINATRESIKGFDGEIDDWYGELFMAEGGESEFVENEIEVLKGYRRSAKSHLAALEKLKLSRQQAEKEKYLCWMRGVPCTAS